MILNRQRAVRVARRPLELFVVRVREALGLGEADVTVCLMSDAEIARMNETFRHKKGATDVLSFPEGERRERLRAQHNRKARVPGGRARPGGRSSDGAVYLGDIAISAPTARRNARKYGRTFGDELRILILHGMLHLLGYDHETDHGEMDRIEGRLRRRLGLA
jgi:probable rRNA maturation factor